MTDQTEGAGLSRGAEPGKQLAVPASSSAPAPSQISSAGGIHVVRFTMRPRGDGTFQIHYKQDNQLPN